MRQEESKNPLDTEYRFFFEIYIYIYIEQETIITKKYMHRYIEHKNGKLNIHFSLKKKKIHDDVRSFHVLGRKEAKNSPVFFASLRLIVC